jgi:hypothetical protein
VWHHVGDVKSINCPNHCQHDLFHTDRLIDRRLGVILLSVLLIAGTLAQTSSHRPL